MLETYTHERSWVDTNKKLPSFSGHYLVYAANSPFAGALEPKSLIGIAYFSAERNCWWNVEMNQPLISISHWMKLPEPPNMD